VATLVTWHQSAGHRLSFRPAWSQSDPTESACLGSSTRFCFLSVLGETSTCGPGSASNPLLRPGLSCFVQGDISVFQVSS
jgi:hypothetical protein